MPIGSHINNYPLVSVIIPCFNHGNYLHKAIESVLKQTYRNIEIVVIDDGSTDNTRVVTEGYPGVVYIYQDNKGLSAARNTGIRNSKGDYLLFLDADDWLYPKGIESNINYLVQHRETAFISGGFDAVYVDKNSIRENVEEVNSDHYCRLLQGNYIGMIATVLFQRWIFKEFSYDESLRNCEDYDLYLKIARKYPVYHHLNKIAAYRLHTSNMSTNIPVMLNGVLSILERQRNSLKTKAEKQAFLAGQNIWKNYYCKELYKKHRSNKAPASKEVLYTLIKYKPSLFIKYILTGKITMIKTIVKNHIPAFGLRWLHKLGLYRNHNPAIGKVKLGDFNRTIPFCNDFGYNRGGPVDRYYIENFLDKEANSIKGRVLEIGDNEYTRRFGGKNVFKSDILHVDESNHKATFIGDLSNAPHIPDNIFDCIVLTQTLHYIYDFKGALRTCHRILKPGGTLLLTAPGITPIDFGKSKETWYWAFTDKAMRSVMAETFPAGETEVNSYGNVFAATTFLFGMGLPEVPRKKLDYHDPQYQVTISVKAQKTTAP